mmetsp:Transcript_35430/g.85912  ORF Transcript_35430/g.85912 Transcript_35430/m.85912 type:complete len:887 (+) Transcript_35430:223-2883(+)|eukprot:CAMPEP_0113624196 /NCGR_PEP_ID=MMETSP0017_2-20120614/12469_1 /TAXON_ID=2856 /ORGANISM="Cylindrotheca closterium" /LENGTH=886 /DNA_ID=CAMNT_0000534211 /DNA_START=97 /DNA_END=2757 /DNA_ORIENTATION=+ /assembly_acc=CAM_ASM_000147
MYRLPKIPTAFFRADIVKTTWKYGTDGLRRSSPVTSLIVRYNASTSDTIGLTQESRQIHRLKHLRNVGILAHVDAGKTTVTERMLALTGVVRRAGSVDDGDTVTDFLPAERERGITIQSAAIAFSWGWHNNRTGDDLEQNDNVKIQLIDTPGHVDFSVEVNRSVAVLDGAVLVLDAVKGVQPQTETVWRALKTPSMNNHDRVPDPDFRRFSHDPLPCIAVINKMDKDGRNFAKAISTIQQKLPGANPLPIQLPLFSKRSGSEISLECKDLVSVAAGSPDEQGETNGDFCGIVDLVHMRALVWPDMKEGSIDKRAPAVVNLLQEESGARDTEDCQVTKMAVSSRSKLIESLAEMDVDMEELFLNDETPSNAQVRAALRRATLAHKAVPVLAAAALKGKGIEPILDAVADLLPSPLERHTPALNGESSADADEGHGMTELKPTTSKITIGHPLHTALLALAFKVVHMKGRGGSGDGRVVFARIYSGKLSERDTVQVISPPAPGEALETIRSERIGGMLELAGGRFDKIEDGVCKSGDVCAIVGLKTVVTGDTIRFAADKTSKSNKGKSQNSDGMYLAGVASPKPVITVRLEAETASDQSRLSEILKLFCIEDPSLVVEETESSTLLSGLGELHIEVTLDRLFREHQLRVMVGSPLVAYYETVKEEIETSGGLLEYDRTIGGTRLQARVHLVVRPVPHEKISSCVMLTTPSVTIGSKAREFLGMNADLSEEMLLQKSDLARALVQGCLGALKRGALKASPLMNVICHIENVDAEGGLATLKRLPGALQAASANAVSVTLAENQDSCTVLEPTMSIEISLPNGMVGDVLSDLTSRRGTVSDVVTGDSEQENSLVLGDVPLSGIIGYANTIRTLTAGEGSFSAEYKGHSPC